MMYMHEFIVMLISMDLASLNRAYLRRGAYGHGCRVARHVEGDAVADLWDIAIMVMGEGISDIN